MTEWAAQEDRDTTGGRGSRRNGSDSARSPFIVDGIDPHRGPRGRDRTPAPDRRCDVDPTGPSGEPPPGQPSVHAQSSSPTRGPHAVADSLPAGRIPVPRHPTRCPLPDPPRVPPSAIGSVAAPADDLRLRTVRALGPPRGRRLPAGGGHGLRVTARRRDARGRRTGRAVGRAGRARRAPRRSTRRGLDDVLSRSVDATCCMRSARVLGGPLPGDPSRVQAAPGRDR
jgi:hypothetical protein